MIVAGGEVDVARTNFLPGAGFADGAGVAEPVVASVNRFWPIFTVEPVETCRASIFPANRQGSSMNDGNDVVLLPSNSPPDHADRQ